MTVIRWTEEARKKVRPLTDAALPEHKPKKLSSAWTALRKKYASRKELFLEGLATADADLAEWTTAADALLSSAEVPSADTPIEVASLFWLLPKTTGTTRPHFMVQLFGVVRAVQTWTTASKFVVWGRDYGMKYQKALTIKRRDDDAAVFPEQSALRGSLMRATEEEYRGARAFAETLFESGALALRTTLVDVFPNETKWVHEVVEQYLVDTTRYNSATPRALHGARISLEDAKRVADHAGAGNCDFESLLDQHGKSALPFLYEVAENASHTAHFEDMARVLSCIDSNEAAMFFSKNISKKAVRKRAAAYFARFPARVEALAPYAEKKTRVARMAQELMAQVARSTANHDLPEADLSELPEVLVNPPWAGGVRPRRKAQTIADLPAALPHEDALHDKNYPSFRVTEGPLMNDREGAEWLAKVAKVAKVDRKDQWRPEVHLHVDRETKAVVPPALRLKVWNEGVWPYQVHSRVGMKLLGEHGLAAVPGLVLWARENLARARQVSQLQVVVDAEVAALAPSVALLLRKRGVNKHVRNWLRRFPEAAIAGLLPAAVGKTGSMLRTSAEQALRWLAAEGHEARIRERSRELGKAGPEAIDEVLCWDPLYDCPKKAPKLPSLYRPEGFTRPMLANGLALPLSAMQHLGEMLAFSLPAEPYGGLAIVKELCTERSLAEFAWSLATAWEHAGGDLPQQWMYYALVHLADDEVVRRTTPALKNALIVDVLSHIHTDAAAMELATVAFREAQSKSPYAGAEVAEAALDAMAEAQGIGRDELDDRITPTLGLDDSGTLLLDFGPRSFRVGFDEHLRPEILDAAGTRRKTLPRGGKKDDPELLAAAKVAWEELKEDVEAVAMFRIDALDRAMLRGRRWHLSDFLTHWAQHPLMMHLTRRIVWAAHGPGDGVVIFRVAEDGTFANANDSVVNLEDTSKVGVPHPSRWPDASLEAWRELFDDYELLQPFHQLNRVMPEVREDELDGPLIERTKGGNPSLAHRAASAYGYSTLPRDPGKDIGGKSQVKPAIYTRRGGLEYRLLHLIDGEQAPWRSAPEGALLKILDELGLHKVEGDV